MPPRNSRTAVRRKPSVRGATTANALRTLKAELQRAGRQGALEKLAAALVGELLDVPVYVASSGFQHGGDAGPAGQRGRRFRIECKKYRDTTALEERDLLGEIDHALARDEALEAWILVATRKVPEQLAQSLMQKGLKHGVPVVIIGWNSHKVPALAALCASSPDLVEKHFSKKAGQCAQALRRAATTGIESLRRELQSWCLGFADLREHSHKKLRDIWTSPRTSNAELAQDAAGGAQRSTVPRPAISAALGQWWNGVAAEDAPAAILGLDGVGKTWATLHWLIDQQDELPITLIVPSSALAGFAVSQTQIKRLVGERLHELTGGARDAQHWQRRFELLLKRPREEGPALVLFIDGLNQVPSVPWLPLLKALQDETFSGRVRLMVSTRNLHYEEHLSRLRGLIAPAVVIEVHSYDKVPGGELDQLLAMEGLAQEQLHPDLRELARRPRLFRLALQLRTKVSDPREINAHRLLWEYGRDSFGARAGRSFGDAEWLEWLKAVADDYRRGTREFSMDTLSSATRRAYHNENDVFARLSEIVDGRFAVTMPSGALAFTPVVVIHALAVALLSHLQRNPQATFGELQADLDSWLDPIAGFDQRADILGAAVSVLLAQDKTTRTLTGALVTAWLQTQNISEEHRRELAATAGPLVDALLDCIEHSTASVQSSARVSAIEAVRAIPQIDATAIARLVERLCGWFRIVSRDVDPRPEAHESQKHRSARLIQWIGEDASGPRRLAGIDLTLVDRDEGVLLGTAPALIENLPRRPFVGVFEVAAAARVVKHYSPAWDAFHWLCLLNEVDPEETTVALRALALDFQGRTAEAGVHPEVPQWLAAMVLWLSGHEADDQAAAALLPAAARQWNYETDYLASPANSFFPLERRHASAVLADSTRPFFPRMERAKEFLLDPSFEVPAAFIDDAGSVARAVEIDKLGRGMTLTIEDNRFEDMKPAIARCDSGELANVTRRILQQFASTPVELRYPRAFRARDYLLLGGVAEGAAAKILRTQVADPDRSQETFAAANLLAMEIHSLDALAQYDAIVNAGLDQIMRDFRGLLRPLSRQDTDELVRRYGAATDKQQRDLLALLSIRPGNFSDATWSWIEARCWSPDQPHAGLAFKTLAPADAGRFGRTLRARNWSWRLAGDLWINHYGSRALAAATLDEPFEALLPRLAPWTVLEAARARGAHPAEIRLAAEYFGLVLRGGEKLETPDPGAEVSLERTDALNFPFVYSIETRRHPQEQQDLAAAFHAMANPQQRIDAVRRAYETARERMDAARASGASLYIVELDPATFEPVIAHALEQVRAWLDGCRERTPVFQRRVQYAESTFMGLCEALLKHDPQVGAELWRALAFRGVLRTRFEGAAGVDDLKHMLFRVGDSPAVEALRQELIRPEHAHTDDALFNIATAAIWNGRADWLSRVIEEDRGDSHVWRRHRALILGRFLEKPALPIAEAWPDGFPRTHEADLVRRAALRRSHEASARYWFQRYRGAESVEEAYAAWILLLRTADRRAERWLREYLNEPRDGDSTLGALKRAHVSFNLRAIARADPHKEDTRQYLGSQIVDTIGPWRRERMHADAD